MSRTIRARSDTTTRSLHDALPIWTRGAGAPGLPEHRARRGRHPRREHRRGVPQGARGEGLAAAALSRDRKSTRLNPSHLGISYAVAGLTETRRRLDQRQVGLRPYGELSCRARSARGPTPRLVPYTTLFRSGLAALGRPGYLNIERGEVAILGESTVEAFRKGLGAKASLRRLFHEIGRAHV